jgi:hypothetical protein
MLKTEPTLGSNELTTYSASPKQPKHASKTAPSPRKKIIQALGSNLLLKDKTLFIKLSPPFEILNALSPELTTKNESIA